MFDSPAEVIMGLVTFTDWWQPSTSSVLHIGSARKINGLADGMPTGLLATLDRRVELARRMQQVDQLDRDVLFLWYVEQLSVAEIARELRISRRHCFRRRAGAIRRVIELGRPEQAA